MSRLIISALIYFFSTLSYADILGTVPTVDEGRVRFVLDLRSDLWLRPAQDKLEPVRIYDNALKVPIYSYGEWSSSFKAEFDGLSFGRTDLRIGPDQVTLGSSLRTQSAGIALRRQLASESSLSAFVSYRSASDEPFKHSRDQWTEVSFLYFSEKRDGFQWVALSNQSHNRGFYNGQWFPFVGIRIDANSEFSYSVGLPFVRLAWNLNSGLATTIVATPTGINGTITKKTNHKFLAVSHFGLAAYSYLHTNRSDPDQRAFYEEKYADIGFKYNLSPDTDMSWSIGGSIDRFVYSGKTVFQADSDRNRLTNDFYSRFIVEFHL